MFKINLLDFLAKLLKGTPLERISAATLKMGRPTTT